MSQPTCITWGEIQRNTCEVQLCKIMNLQNENEELKERVKYLKSKIDAKAKKDPR